MSATYYPDLDEWVDDNDETHPKNPSFNNEEQKKENDLAVNSL